MKNEDSAETEDNEYEKSDLLAYSGAVGAAIFLGLADYLASLLARLGLSGIFAEWFGCIMAFLGYHAYCYINWHYTHEEDDTVYFSKAKSMYYEVDDGAAMRLDTNTTTPKRIEQTPANNGEGSAAQL